MRYAPAGVGISCWKQGNDDEDEDEDEELQRHYKELEAIKQEEEEKNRQRVLGAEASSVEGCAEDGDDGGTWEDAAVTDEADTVKADDDAMGLKPIDHDKWQQRQVCFRTFRMGCTSRQLSGESTAFTSIGIE